MALRRFNAGGKKQKEHSELVRAVFVVIFAVCKTIVQVLSLESSNQVATCMLHTPAGLDQVCLTRSLRRSKSRSSSGANCKISQAHGICTESSWPCLLDFLPSGGNQRGLRLVRHGWLRQEQTQLPSNLALITSTNSHTSYWYPMS